jgi:hypothetical protein
MSRQHVCEHSDWARSSIGSCWRITSWRCGRPELHAAAYLPYLSTFASRTDDDSMRPCERMQHAGRRGGAQGRAGLSAGQSFGGG